MRTTSRNCTAQEIYTHEFSVGQKVLVDREDGTVEWTGPFKLKSLDIRFAISGRNGALVTHSLSFPIAPIS